MRWSRRQCLKVLAHSGIALPLAHGLSPFLGPRPLALAQGSKPKRFLQIILRGGWDMVLTTDPVPNASHAKAQSGGFAAAYYDPDDGSYVGAPTAVTGKPNLLLGAGLADLAPRLSEVPTAFVNGMFVEVTAHELALAYMLSGRLSLSRSKEYPALVAIAAEKRGGFPAHVVLGPGVPLASTKNTYPPLQALNTDTLVSMLAGAYGGDYKKATIDAAEALITTLNQEFQAGLGSSAVDSLAAWSTAETGLAGLYAQRFDQKVGLTDTLRSDFGAGEDNNSFGAMLATAFLVLKEGVSPYASVSMDGFDTHSNHLLMHRPLLSTLTAATSGLLRYLQEATDPDSATNKLIETTTVLICSEFNRTPSFNAAGGTDHWQTGSAILMGQGVVDNTVVGATNEMGEASEVQGAKILPDHLIASLLRTLGYKEEGDAISEVQLGVLA